MQIYLVGNGAISGSGQGSDMIGSCGEDKLEKRRLKAESTSEATITNSIRSRHSSKAAEVCRRLTIRKI